MSEETQQPPVSPSQGGPVSQPVSVVSSPEVQPETQAEPPPEKPRIQKKKILIGLGVFFGVLAIGGAVFGAYLVNQKRTQPVPQPTPNPEAPTPTPDPTADWERYTNEEYKFSFRYPKNFQIKTLPSLEKSYFINEPIPLRLELTQNIYQDIGQYPAIVLSVVKTEKTIEQLLDYIEEVNTKAAEDLKNPESIYYGQPPPEINSVETINVDGLETIKVERYLGPGGPNPNVLEYYLASSPYIFVFSVNYGTYNPDVGQDGTEEKETLSRMITTFKFLEEEVLEEERVYCEEPRPEFCTMECIVNPPYICGSDGRSYCSTCQACANSRVEWYVIQDEPCSQP